MKLATLRHGGRDGTLTVVNRDLTLMQPVPGIAATLQAALDDWAAAEPELGEDALLGRVGGLDRRWVGRSRRGTQYGGEDEHGERHRARRA